MKITLTHRAVTLTLFVTLMSVSLPSCSQEEANRAGRGSLLTGPSEGPQGTGADLDELGPTLSLTPQEGRLVLSYTRREGQVAPRTAELFLSYPSSLDLAEARPGEALLLASKELIVQSPSPEVLRLVIMSTGNLNTVNSGPLAYLTFNGPPQALSQVFLQARQPYFAPAEANVGVTLSPVSSARDSSAANATTVEE